MINGIYLVKYSVRNSLDKLDYPDEDLYYGSKYWFLLNRSKYIFGFSFVVWCCFFFTLINLNIFSQVLVHLYICNQRRQSFRVSNDHSFQKIIFTMLSLNQYDKNLFCKPPQASTTLYTCFIFYFQGVFVCERLGYAPINDLCSIAGLEPIECLFQGFKDVNIGEIGSIEIIEFFNKRYRI